MRQGLDIIKESFHKLPSKILPHIGWNSVNINKEIDKDLLKKINFEINNHPIEKIGLELRKSMTAMKNLF